MKHRQSFHDRYSFKNIQTKMLHYCCNVHKQKNSINNDTNYIIRSTMSTSRIQYLIFFFKIYKGMQVIITQNLYLKLQNFNESRGRIENKFFINVKWI